MDNCIALLSEKIEQGANHVFFETNDAVCHIHRFGSRWLFLDGGKQLKMINTVRMIAFIVDVSPKLVGYIDENDVPIVLYDIR
jgi:hypothetical protein